MRIIAIANHKGGCGKTTTSINFAACLAHLKKKVLLIDLDPQGHSTCGLNIRAEDQPCTVYDLLHPPANRIPKASQLLCEINPNFYLMPSYGILAAIEEELVNVEGRDERLSLRLYQLFEDAPKFDYVILDCPPNLGLITYNALTAADEVMIPIEPSFFSLHGLAKMSETIKSIEEKSHQEMEVHALLTIFNSQLSFSGEILEEVKEHFGERLFKAIIHDNVAFKEASCAGESIVDHQPESSAFQDYLKLAVEYLERDWDRIYPKKKLGWDNVLFHRFGPKRVSGGVLFQVLNDDARWVEIAGDFNQWVPESLVKRESDGGLWQKVIPLTGGRYRYKFIVDGEWQVDPYQPEQINQHGGTDSFLEIA